MSWKQFALEDEVLTSIANAVRSKTETSALIELQALPTLIENKIPDYSEFYRSVADGTVTSVSASHLKGVTRLRAHAFQRCYNLETVELPDGLTFIGGGCFQGDSKLKNVKIPETVTYIGNEVFMDCSSITKIIIPQNVTTIGANAFTNCTSLATIECRATTPPTITDTSLPGTSIVKHIYVPADSVDAYKAAAGWSAYADIIEAIP